MAQTFDDTFTVDFLGAAAFLLPTNYSAAERRREESAVWYSLTDWTADTGSVIRLSEAFVLVSPSSLVANLCI